MKTFENKSVLENRNKARKKFILVISILCLFVLFIGFSLNNFSLTDQTSALNAKKKKNSVAYSTIPKEELKKNGLATLDIRIPPKSLKKIIIVRNEAQRIKTLLNERNIEVPAKLSVNGKDFIPIEIRLKGDDILGHIEADGLQWPYRIKLLGKNKVFGMSRFSIHDDRVRHGHEEMLLLDYERMNSIIAPRYNYVNVVINGIDNGVMALEEHFTKEMLESMGMRESVILALDEDYFWRQRSTNHRLHQNMYPGSKAAYGSLQFDRENLPFKVFNEEDVWKTPTLNRFYKEALGLMRSFRAGEIDQSEVIDNEVYAKYMAITHLWNRHHGLLYYNIRMYYNPITRLFEPVSFDNDYLTGLSYHPLALLTSSEKFFEYYKKDLNELLEEINSGKFFKTLTKLENTVYPALNEDFEGNYKRFSLETFKERMTFLQDNEKKISAPKRHEWEQKPFNFRNAPLIIDDFLLVFIVKGDDGKNYLEFQNVTDKSVTLNEIFFSSNIKSDFIIKKHIEIPEGKKVIPPYLEMHDHIKIAVPQFPLNGKEEYHVIATYNSVNYKKEYVAKRYFPPANKVKYRPDDVVSFIRKFPFIKVSYKNEASIKAGNFELKFNPDNINSFTIPKGEWHVTDHMLIPEDKPLYIEPGAVLCFDEGKRFVIRSPLIASGSEDEPIIFKVYREKNILKELLKPFKYWGGIVVLKTHGDNILNNIIIKDIGPVKNDDWELTGAVTFYESPVDIINTQFLGNMVEDSLNIIRSSFTMTNTIFKDTASDALDIDFGKGVIKDTKFYNTGGDALDISGTDLKANNIYIQKAKDKGLSIGEKSVFDGKQIDINGANIGIASKDGSKATLSDSKLSYISYTAFMAYLKKPEYTKSELIIKNCKTNMVNQLSGAVKPCTITIDNKLQPFKDINISKLYSKESSPKNSKQNLNRIQNTQQDIKEIETEETKSKWEEGSDIQLDKNGVTILLDRIYNNSAFYLELDYSNAYNVLFYNDSKLVDFLSLRNDRRSSTGTYVFKEIVPESAVNEGYNRIVIYPFARYNKEPSKGFIKLSSIKELQLEKGRRIAY